MYALRGGKEVAFLISAGVHAALAEHLDYKMNQNRWRLTLNVNTRSSFLTAVICAVFLIFPCLQLAAQDAQFHDAPQSSVHLKNPYAGQQAAVAAGSRLYATNCASCHGVSGDGNGKNPAVSQGPTQSAPDGELFWFITTGASDKGMPAWSALPERQRWQIVTYLKSLKPSSSAQKAAPESTK
jgi:mono/diheme cytochrome c family protein